MCGGIGLRNKAIKELRGYGWKIKGISEAFEISHTMVTIILKKE